MSAESGRTAIVTGASSGIGLASAEALARAGFTVFGASRKAGNEGPSGAKMLVCDVTNDKSVAALISAVLAQTGRIDLLVNNAGVGMFGGAEILGRSIARTFRHQPVWRDAHDQRRSARHAKARRRAHPQYRLDPRIDSGALLSALRRGQTCGRGVLGIARS